MNTFNHSSGGSGQTLAVSSTVVQFAAFALPSDFVRIKVQGNAVIATFDNTTPSGSNGEVFAAGEGGYMLRKDLLRMKFIRQSGDALVFAQPCNLIVPGSVLNA